MKTQRNMEGGTTKDFKTSGEIYFTGEKKTL